ncbi:MAG: hypothetical protein PVF35_05175 [Gammaproteobacteria bacterium]|jgi:hypothetical protein
MFLPQLKWPGLTGENTLIITVDKQDFAIKPKSLQYDARIFVPKQETHITVWGSELGTKLLQQLIQHPELEQDIHNAFESTDWSYQKTSDLRHLARKKAIPGKNDITEETIVMLIKMEGMAVFYSKLKDLGLIGKDHPVPPPHVTLYTRNIDRGIGVDSESELAELSQGRVDLEF